MSGPVVPALMTGTRCHVQRRQPVDIDRSRASSTGSSAATGPIARGLMRLASALGRVDRGAARALLTELERIQPLRPEAERAMQELASDAAP